jgi:hypothetical protein
MKYIAQPDGLFAAFDESSELFAQLSELPKERRPVFLSESSKEVKAYFAAQAEAAKPVSVTMRQARLALLEAGLLDNVQNLVAGMQGVEGAAARIEWEYSSTMVRSQPLVASLAAALKLKSADVDALFLSASTK